MPSSANPGHIVLLGGDGGAARGAVPSHHPASHTVRPAQVPPAAVRVLVVDDVPAQRYAVTQALRRSGFVVAEAASGAEALAAHTATPCDVAVLDIELQDMSGFAVGRQLRDCADRPCPAVLYLSSVHVSAADRTAGIESGASGFMTHPFDPAELRAVVGTLGRPRLPRADATPPRVGPQRSLVRETLDMLPERVVLLDAMGTVVGANRRWVEFLTEIGANLPNGGLDVNYIELSHRLARSIGPDARNVGHGVAEVLAGRVQSFEMEYRGERLAQDPWFRVSAWKTHAEPGVAVVVCHSSRPVKQCAAQERADLLASVEAERAQLLTVFEHTPAILAVFRGPRLIVERLNPAAQQLLGFRTMLGRPAEDVVPDLVAQGFTQRLAHVLTTGKPYTARQLPVLLANSGSSAPRMHYMNLVYHRLVSPDGQHAVVVHGVDVTRQVEASLALALNERRLRDQFAKLPVPTFLWEDRGTDWQLLECNEAASSVFPDLCTDPSGTRAQAVFPNVPSLGTDVRLALRDNVVLRRNVTVNAGVPPVPRSFEITVGPQLPSRVIVHAVDTTERVELEEQLRQASKMEAVGRLAGGVAHDFNNLLTVIGAHSTFLLEELAHVPAAHADALAIQLTTARASALTAQLLAFSRKQIVQPRLLHLNDVLAAPRTMLGRLLGEDIEIETDLAADLPCVWADSGHLEQVLLNLALNARDAMPEGGRLRFATSHVTVGEAGDPDHVPPGSYVLLAVSDSGVGMSDSVKGRLFEPFFTTKPPGKGTGLGLSTVFGIVQQANGHITVASDAGHGSTFCVYLPEAACGTASDTLPPAHGVPARGVETILVVEDEPAIRSVLTRMLTRLGYLVLSAASGAAAIAVSASYDAQIDLVLSDAIMPGLGGDETVLELQRHRPGLRALFMSGYPDDEIVRRGITAQTAPFVQKPFSVDSLAQAVRDALDA